jgi:hypothetical protein
MANKSRKSRKPSTPKKARKRRYNLDQFCTKFKLKNLQLASFLGVKPQQINNWKIANEKRQNVDGIDAYIVELNIANQQVNIIKTEKITNHFDVDLLEV